jgi:hypothetical protein
MKREQGILLRKLCVILQRSLVEARNLALTDNCRQIHDLADSVEILPAMVAGWDEQDVETVRRVLSDYQSKYPGTAYDYLSILDMDEREFVEVFQLT